MSPGVLGMLFGIGIIGGCANAIAGGATLITFPAMVASGLPLVAANASNSVAVMPGNIIAALTDRAKWPPIDRRFIAFVLMSMAGSVIGSWLLISHSDKSFMQLVPALIGVATLLFAFAPRLQALAARMRSNSAPGPTSPALIGLTAIYGGYFGAGIGVMFMAILAIIDNRELRTLNVIKNLLGFAVALPAAIVFIANGSVAWPQTLAMLVGASAGGFLGARLIRIIPPLAMRRTVSTIGIVMTAIYVYRYWLS